MVVDFGMVKSYIKPKADSSLRNMRKADLIEYIRTLEHNYNVAVSFNENQARYIQTDLETNDGKRIPARLADVGALVMYLEAKIELLENNKHFYEVFGSRGERYPIEKCYKEILDLVLRLAEVASGERSAYEENQ